MHLNIDAPFVHGPLAESAFGIEERATLTRQVAAAVGVQRIPDLRIVALGNDLSTYVDRIVTIRAGFYFKRGRGGRNRFHASLDIDLDRSLRIHGTYSSEWLQGVSAPGNLSGRRNVLVVGILKEAHMGARTVSIELRPIVIGFPFYTEQLDDDDHQLGSARPEVYSIQVDQFRLNDSDLRYRPSKTELRRLFDMSEQSVKEAFASLLGVTFIPADYGGERSDLTADISLEGARVRAAFALKGPGGRRNPWTLHPAQMGHRGDQALRLATEDADVLIVQHCSAISEQVRHLMDAVCTLHGKRYLLLPGDHTVRIFRKAGLLE